MIRHPPLPALALAGLAAVLALVPSAMGGGPPRAAAAARTWVPAPHTTWQWQLTGRLDTSVAAQMFDVDLFDTATGVIADLHRRSRRVICYLDAGTWENWRPDAGSFPRSLLGRPNGWPGERWLDIRRLAVLGPIMRARLALCKAKGFDGVEADNVDGYEQNTGFRLTAGDQLTYNRWLARSAHALGLSIALKNDVDQARQLEPVFDFALDEQCFQYSECFKLRPFVAAHKAVFEVEYVLAPARFCPQANRDGFMAMRKALRLDVTRTVCWP